MRLQGLTPISGAAQPAGRPRAEFIEGLRLWAEAPTAQVASGGTVNTVVHWLPTKKVPDFATSLRLVAPDGSAWSQPPTRSRSARSFLPASGRPARSSASRWSCRSRRARRQASTRWS